jgi:hypothetical protein
MADSETSFDSYTFTYKWRINDLATRIYNASGLNSPTFCSPNGATPATKWMLCLNISTPPRGHRQPIPTATVADEQSRSLDLELKRLPCSPETTPGHIKKKRAPELPDFGLPQSRGLTQDAIVISGHSGSALQLQQQREADARSVWVEASLTPFISTSDTVSKCTRMTQEPVRCHCNTRLGSSAIHFQHLVAGSKIRGSNSVMLECEINVWLNQYT